MSGRGIDDLSKPEKRFRPSRVPRVATRGFETKESVAAEDARRAKALRRCALKFPTIIERDAADLVANKLVPLVGSRPRFTLASAVSYRKRRNAVGGHLWKLVETCGLTPVVTATVIPHGWDIPGLDLRQVNPIKFMERFRKALNECGAIGCEGFIFASMHGEYEPSEGVWRLHIHLVAAGKMVAVLKRLQKRKGYRGKQSASSADAGPVYRRIRISDKPLTNLPAPLTYTMQSFWPARSIYAAEDGPKRQARKRRIEEPFHSILLLWMDQWSLSDLTMIMGARVTRSGFVLTRKRGTRNIPMKAVEEGLSSQ